MAVAASQTYAAYDPLAWFYDRYWGPRSAEQVLPAVEAELLPELGEQPRILDLCCGTGQLAGALAEMGVEVTGVEGSRAMLAYARNNAPQIPFRLEDARGFRAQDPYDAVLAIDCLKHLVTEEDLAQAFQAVADALVDGGVFFFDMDMEEAYDHRWTGPHGIIEDDHLLFAENTVDPEHRTGTSQVTLFRYANGAWRRSDLTLEHRWYPEEKILDLLAEAGFEEATIYEAEEDLGMTGEQGRRFFRVQTGG